MRKVATHVTSDKVRSCTGKAGREGKGGGKKGQWKCKWERLEIDSSELEQRLVQSKEGRGRKGVCVCVLEECVCVRRECVRREESNVCVCVRVKYVCPALSHFLSFSLHSVI